ncbi:MAG TPA: trigger factor [Anaeromyxobacteraceae bacterium]|nr:trigger factor [Anaeromyxobacteraceae bacterium]
MKIQVENLSPVEKKVTVEIDPDRVASELSRAYESLGRRVKLKGFRPGKAPRHVLERNFREEVEAEVLERLVQDTFAQAVREQSIDAVAPPRVQVGEGGLAGGRPLGYTARVEVKPRLEPRDYRGLQAPRKTAEVSDQMVADELTRLQQSMAQLVPVEGRFEAQPGDVALVDHQGTIGGQPFPGGKAEGVAVQVGEGDLWSGFLAALAGKKLGETVEVDQAFPADHRVAELRGRVAHLAVTLKALKARQVPALDDELAKDLGVEGVVTLADLKSRIRRDLEKQGARRVEAETRDALIRAALLKNDFEVPPALVERAIDSMLEETAERFARQGVDIRRLDLDVARLRADLRENALLQVKGALLLEAIAEAEKIEVSEAEVQAEAARIAEAMGVPLAKIQGQISGADSLRALRSKIRGDKALDFLASQANFA